MTSRDIKELLQAETGIKELYHKHKKYFDLVDSWTTRFAEGDLLDEYSLADAMEKLTGCYGKFVIVGNAIDAYKTNKELSYKETKFAELRANKEKPNVSQLNEQARASTSELRAIRADFLNYADASQKGIGTCQSRLKRLTVEKGAKKVDYTGERPVDVKPEEVEPTWDE